MSEELPLAHEALRTAQGLLREAHAMRLTWEPVDLERRAQVAATMAVAIRLGDIYEALDEIVGWAMRKDYQ